MRCWLSKFWLFFYTPLLLHGQDQVDSISFSIDFEDVVVTAQVAPTSSKNSIYAVRVIDRRSIEQKASLNLQELLSQELNMRINQDRILGSSLDMQGISGQNVKIMLDGVPITGRVGDDIDLSQIPLENIDRIEVVDGPLSVQYGTNALGGVINLISRRSQINPIQIKAQGQWESQGVQDAQLRTGFRLHPDWLLQFSGGLYDFEGYKQEEGRDFLWNPKFQYRAGALLRHNLSEDQQLRLQGNFLKEIIDNPGEIRRPQFKPYAFDDQYVTHRYQAALFQEGKITEQWYMQTTIGINGFNRTKKSQRLDLHSGELLTLSGQQDTNIYVLYNLRSVIAGQWSGKWNLQAGLDLTHETGEGTRLEKQYLRGVSQTDIAVFSSVNFKPSNRWDWQLGLRGAYNTRYAAPLTPSLHIKYKASERLQFRGSLASGFRSPSIKELFFYFVDANHLIYGNRDLLAETSKNVQLQSEWNNKGLKMSLLGFYNNIHNKIDLYDFVEINGQRIPAASLDTLTLEFTYFNQNRFKSLGAAFRTEWKWKNLQFNAGLAPIGQTDAPELSDDLVFILESNAGMAWHHEKSKLDLSMQWKRNDKRVQYYQVQDASSGEISTGKRIQKGFTLLDVLVNKSFWKNHIQLGIGAKNLLNIQQTNTLQAEGTPHGGSSSLVSPGRSYFLRMMVKY